MYTIRQVAETYGVTHRTLRFWEQKDLLHPVKENKNRFYDEAAISEIDYIVAHKALGIELHDLWTVRNRGVSVADMIPELLVKATKERDEAQAKIDAIAAWGK